MRRALLSWSLCSAAIPPFRTAAAVRARSTVIVLGRRAASIPQPVVPRQSIWVYIAVLGHREPTMTSKKNITTSRMVDNWISNRSSNNQIYISVAHKMLR